MNMGLQDKVALVTGGSRGLGRAICLGLAAEGAKVVVHYANNGAKGEEVVAACRELGVEAVALQADLADPEKTRTLIAKAVTTFGQLDILVNNAGIWPTAYVKDMSEEDWQLTMDVNLKAPFVLCRDLVNHLLERGVKGKILNITSQAGFHGSTSGHAHYAASKGGMITFTRSLAREVAKDGITVNALAPGLVETDMAGPALAKNIDRYLSRIPLGKIAKPEEVAAVAVFMVSEPASYMTGTTIDVTGGMLMR